MGWNFTIAKGGSLGSILACWVIGILYISLIMINTEMGSVMPEAGGQYAMAKYLLGPIAAFNVGLMLVFQYVMLEAADALVVGSVLETLNPDIQALPYIILSLLLLTWLNYRGMHATLNLNIVLTGFAFLAIIILLFSSKFYSPSESLLNLEGLMNGLPYGWIGILGAFQFGCWFYLGIEGTVLAAEECRSPARSLPVGTVAGMIAARIATQTRAHWIDAFRRAGVPAAPCLRVDELFDDEHLCANDLWWESDHPRWGRIRQPGATVRWHARPMRIDRRAPLLAEHTLEVLREFAIDAARVATLLESATVVQRAAQ